MNRNAMRRYLGLRFRGSWIDLVFLGPALRSAPGSQPKTMDEWLSACDIVHYRRHDALADALATAQLFQVMVRRADASGMSRTADLMEAARSQEWLSRRSR
ncbi:MAG: hypothetical protein EXR27_04660 [Betaproteobacteria bacterium]|nr:hypothetical protein [Betaproteobacteria bacterium]